MRRVVVTGLGAVTPLGIGVKSSWKRLVQGHCGVVSLKDRGTAFHGLKCQVAGLVPQTQLGEGRWAAKDWLSRDDERRMSKFMHYAMAASQEALDDAGWKPANDEEREMTGVCLGSGIGSFEEMYQTSLAYDRGGSKKVSPLFVPKLLVNLAAGHISIKHGFMGPNHAVTTACTTGAHSIGDASRFIGCGDADVMVAGGGESCIHPLAFVGFERSHALTTSSNNNPSRASRPFDKTRDGFVIGEGAAVLVLESLEHALARSAKIHAEVAGYGVSADAYHLIAPPASGQGAYRAMKLALKNAATPPSEIDYINAHATSTPLGDAAENQAVKRLMLEGHDGRDSAHDINVSSTKGAVGHLLGAAGAIEALFSVLAIHNNMLPPTLNLEELDGPEFDCNYVPQVAQERKVDAVLSNSFGFGGTNASLCFKRYP